MIFSFDDFYNTDFYNTTIEHLFELGIPFKEFLHIKSYKWYLDCEIDPTILKYDEISGTSKRLLISKTIPLTSSDEYKYRRRQANSSSSAAISLCFNDAYNYFKDFISFIWLDNNESARELSKHIGRIYYFGRYFSNRYRVYGCKNSYLKNFVNPERILSEGSIVQAELKLNYSIFKLQDFLEKYSQTPYWDSGLYFAPNVLAKKFKSGS